jgi:hypothetical protein
MLLHCEDALNPCEGEMMKQKIVKGHAHNFWHGYDGQSLKHWNDLGYFLSHVHKWNDQGYESVVAVFDPPAEGSTVEKEYQHTVPLDNLGQYFRDLRKKEPCAHEPAKIDRIHIIHGIVHGFCKCGKRLKAEKWVRV